ncbi:DUF1697 domain-containing protein [Arthrobacter caoxuetaonis]|uniref:DUF1697 domain-containing protein n=1 Tax=Arthrobacter caoxuetaonis TaxID=2886935 RepID=UPI001D13D5F8|nr:DUF1697 domain-containing protein [Arthrobacter caoxuetaonis]MCC3282453.1 DUF1697 domain-containing protein [Arthrobacter caoxuetaonis]
MKGSVTRFAILLRGVNVGGITVKMADLRAVLQGLGLQAVRTLLASGNAVVTSDLEPVVLKASVEQALRTEFGYEAWVIVLPVTRVAELADAVPYAADDPAVHAYVTFSSDPGVLDELVGLGAAAGQEQVRLGAEAVAWTARKGLTLDSTLSKATGKPRYKSATTTRNLRTLHKIVDAG